MVQSWRLLLQPECHFILLINTYLLEFARWLWIRHCLSRLLLRCLRAVFMSVLVKCTSNATDVDVPLTWKIKSRWYIQTEVDAWLLVNACRDKDFFARIESKPLIHSGCILIYQAKLREPENHDGYNWEMVDVDSTDTHMIIHRSPSNGLMKKEVTIDVCSNLYRLVFYYDPWETMGQGLRSPSGVETFGRVPEELRQRAKCLSPTEKLRTCLQVCSHLLYLSSANDFQKTGSIHLEFVRHAKILIASWLSYSAHTTLRKYIQQTNFPFIPTNNLYWKGLTKSTWFFGKSADQLRYQMEALLYELLSVFLCMDDVRCFLLLLFLIDILLCFLLCFWFSIRWRRRWR